MTLLLLIFGEIVPKTFAARHAEGFAFAVVRPLQIIEWALFPLVQALRILSSLFGRLTGAATNRSLVTEQEIRSLISIGKEAGAVESSEAEMLEKVFHFGDHHVSEIMTPRAGNRIYRAAHHPTPLSWHICRALPHPLPRFRGHCGQRNRDPFDKGRAQGPG